MPPGLPAAVALLRKEVKALDIAVAGEAEKRAANVHRLDGDIARMDQQLAWLNRQVDNILRHLGISSV